MKCKHVFILGFDGAGNAPRDVETPNMDRVFSRGAYTYNATAVFPTISAECWGAMLTSVGPETHKLTNDIVSSHPYPIDSPYPTVFRLLREQMPDAVLASFSEWSPINSGIIEDNLNCYKETGHGMELGKKIADYLHENKPTMLFLQLDGPDGGGHTHGYFTEGHYESIREADKVLGVILDAIEKENMWEESLIILVTDHGGGGGNPRSHGTDSPLDKTVYWGCCGPMIANVGEISSEVNIADTAMVAAMALGLKAPAAWTGKVPQGILKD